MIQKNFSLTFAGKDYNVWYIREKSTAVECLRAIKEKGREPLALDFETYADVSAGRDGALDPLLSRPRLVQVCDGFNIVVLDLLHIGGMDLRDFFEETKFIAHNAIFEIQHLLHSFGCKRLDVGCTRIATRLIYDGIYPNSSAYPADLGTVVKALLKFDLPKDIDHRCWGEPELTYEQVCYAAGDVGVMPMLAEKLSNGLIKHGLGKVYQLYKESQVPLAKMQLNGIKMDRPKHRQLIAEWKHEAHKAKTDLLKLTGLLDTNPNSIIGFLESTLPPNILAIWPRTEGGDSESGRKGQLSISSDTFADFSFLEIVEPFSRLKKAIKLSTTYGEKLYNRNHSVTGRIHCSYNLCGTRTGRLSSSHPNLQQLPRDKQTRSLFVAPPGRKLCVADFNQIELRVAAEFSRDPEMLRAYKAGRDLHAVTAEMLSRKPLSEMAPEEAKKARQNAKALNFGLLFGLGPNKFKHYAKKNYKVDLTEGEAYASVLDWHQLYAGYSDWHSEISQKCRETKRIRTASGKLRALNEENYYGASANTPIQGSASECLLRSLIRLNDSLDSRDSLVNTVHDEIMIETDNNEEDVERVKGLLRSCMKEGFRDIFPAGIVSENLTEVKSGFNWAECK